MLRSNHLFKLLSAVIILFCVYAFSAGVNDPDGKVSPAVTVRKKLQEIYISQIGVRELTGAVITIIFCLVIRGRMYP
ncbi:hypothetical protein [Desertivirga xinjiangensis]|uniref:hypothetical protein n=1 Tax=Desertivirga xinjiangensis TaxID=539206 RepID=UPI002109D824|nr:hypothetical protein [Pedobacter xinjiangensis]